MIGGVATGISGDSDAVARLERVLLNSLTAELAGGAPLGGPGDGLVLLARNFQKNRRMRVAEEELDDRAFKGDCLRRIGAGEGVVGMGVTSAKQGDGEQEATQREFCKSRHR